MGQRRDRLNKRLERATATRRTNSVQKAAASRRRDTQMLTLLKEGQFPYTPGIMSWLSRHLGKKASRITAADVKPLLADKRKP